MYPRAAAEFLGTFILVSAILFAGANPLYIAAAFLAAITIAGPISGGHLNPAVSLTMLTKGDLTKGLYAQYVAAQVAGALAALFVFKAIKRA
jgi:glycerol uptake facilitator-like aquaporin